MIKVYNIYNKKRISVRVRVSERKTTAEKNGS